MSMMRIGGAETPVVNTPAPKAKVAPKTGTDEAESPAVSQQVVKESFISSLSAHRQPPKMALGSMFSQNPTSVEVVFASELDALERRTSDEVAGDLAVAFLGYADVARREGDGDLDDAFNELGELMRGYEHIRMLKNGELG